VHHSHWHILGAGAIGCLFAQALQAHTRTTLVLRPGATHDDCITVRGESAETVIPIPCSYSSERTEINQLLVTTKAYDVEDALHSVAHRLRAGSTIVLMVNGMGLAERVRARYAQHTVFSATTTAGAHRLGHLHIRPAGRGETRVGRQHQLQPAPWFEAWREALDPCVWDDDIDSALWHKLAVNTVINPVTALYRCNNGQLAEQPALQALVASLCREASQISYAAGYTRTAQTLLSQAQAVIRATASNRSSMLQDIEAGRPTEIDYITGYLLETGDRFGIVAPEHRALFNAIKKSEERHIVP
jgi:2-dehydropantoate 2-reductase